MFKPLTPEQNMEILGKTGEKIVCNFYSRKGKIVEQSINNYDSDKDLTVDGARIEVKTQVPFITKSSFTFKPNQLRKCLQADGIIFVSVPNKMRPHYSSGKVYLANPSDLKYNKHKTKDGRDMILVPITQDALQELFTLTEQECEELMKYSVSSWM